MRSKPWRLMAVVSACAMPLIAGCSGGLTNENVPERVITEEEVRAVQGLPMPDSKYIIEEKPKK